MAETYPSFEAQAQKMAQQHTTTEATSFLLGSLLGGFMLVALLRSPFIIIYLLTGRFKQGWTLRRNSHTSQTTSCRNWRVKGNRFTISGLQPRKTQKLYIEYLYWYNRLSLQSVWRCQVFTLAKLSIVLFYLMSVVISIFWKNWRGDEFFSHFRRPAFIAIVQLPVMFLLAMKNNICGFLGIGFERINFLHRLAGRIVVLCSIIHAGLILNVQVSPLRELFKQSTFMFGGISLAIMILVTLTSIGPIRKRFYQCFLAVHILGYLLLLWALWKHVEATHLPILICCACKAVDQICQAINTTFRTAQFTSLPGKITIVEVPNLGNGWRAGQFIFLRVYSPKYILEKHPFTIANAPATDSPYSTKDNLVLIAKANGDYTRRIHEIGLTKAAMESQNSELKSPHSLRADSVSTEETKPELGLIDSTYDSQLMVSVEGPYGHMCHDMRNHETAVLIGAGVACTFVMSLLEEIVGLAVKASSATRNILIYWTLRDIDMVEFFLEPIRENMRIAQELDIAVQIKIHVTSSIGVYRPQPSRELTIIQRRLDLKEVVDEAVNITIAEINALGRFDAACGVGIASASGSTAFCKALRDATLSVDRKTFTEIGGITVHTEIFDNQ